MAEILVRSVDNSNPDPAKDKFCYKTGDPVLVKPDGHQWSRMESLRQWVSEGNLEADWPGGFLIIKVPGLEPSQVEQYLQETIDLRREYKIRASFLTPDEYNEKTIANLATAVRRK